MKKISLFLLSFFYIIAGVNHFFNPQFYFPLIPAYLPYPNVINTMSGVLELVLGIGVLFSLTRSAACSCIIILLLAFIPAHIYFIQMGGCMSKSLCVPVWVAWVRLVVVHPILIYWAYKSRTIK